MKYLFLIIFIFTQHLTAQNALSSNKLDSLFNIFIQIKTGNSLLPQTHLSHTSENDTLHSKCGFYIVNEVRRNFHLFTNEQQQMLKVFFQRPQRETSFVSPSGYFRIHYNSSGSEVPGYDLQELAIALDSSYNFHINFLGYPVPPHDNGAGGDNLYDVYLVSLGTGLYGYTEFEPINSGDLTGPSFMVIDNNFATHFTKGIDGARVTVAHEFHHAIQLGSYIYRPSDIFFYEITSTAMEKFVYETIDDYLAYMGDYFRNPDRTFSQNNGYNLAIWNFMMKERFGYDIIKRQWELMSYMRALQAIDYSLKEVGSLFLDELNRFGVWAHFTGHRAIPGKFFRQAAIYPLIRPLTTLFFNSSAQNVSLNARPLSNNFIQFKMGSGFVQDTLVILITNADIVNAIGNNPQVTQFEYTLFNYQGSSSKKITREHYSYLRVDNSNFWSESVIFNDTVTYGSETFVDTGNGNGKPQIEDIEKYIYPNPFRYGYLLGDKIYVPVEIDDELKSQKKIEGAHLYIYTSSMNLVYSKLLEIKKKREWYIVEWNGRNNKNEKLASGVYLYVTKAGNNINNGKIVIFNE